MQARSSIGVVLRLEIANLPEGTGLGAPGSSKRQNARKRGWTLEFCTIRTKTVRIGAPHRLESPDLIDRTGICVDYLRLIQFAEPSRWYVSCKIRVREGRTVHYGYAHHQYFRRIHSPSDTMRGTSHYRPAYHGRTRIVNMPASPFRTCLDVAPTIDALPNRDALRLGGL